MSYVVVAVAGATVVASFVSSSAAHDAADTMANASNNATSAQEGMFNEQLARSKPYMDAGYDALNQIKQNQGYYNQPFTKDQFHQDPGYQFDLQQGEQAIQNSAAASGHMISSQQLGNASNYAENMANNQFESAYNRYRQGQQDSFNRLASVAQIGQTGVGQTNQSSQNAANNISSNLIGAGNAQAAAQVGTANAITSGISGAANGYMNYSTMSNLMGNAAYGTPGYASTAADINGMNGSSNLTMPQLGSSSGFSQTSPVYSLY